MRVAFLGHNQPLGSSLPAGGFLSKTVAELLVRNLAAERISQKEIRAFSPTSAFVALQRERCRYIPVKLPPKEVENVKFSPPKEAGLSVPRSRYLPRFREIYGDQQLAASL